MWDGKVFLRGGPGAELDNNSRLWLPPPVLHDMPALRDPGRASNVDFHEQVRLEVFAGLSFQLRTSADEF